MRSLAFLIPALCLLFFSSATVSAQSWFGIIQDNEGLDFDEYQIVSTGLSLGTENHCSTDWQLFLAVLIPRDGGPVLLRTFGVRVSEDRPRPGTRLTARRLFSCGFDHVLVRLEVEPPT